jgi:hypothetical protein
MRRMVVFVVVAAMSVATIAGPVAAQAERERIEYPRTTFGPGLTENPCVPGEFVEISGWTEGFYNIVETPSGPIIKGEFVQHAAGVDAEGNKWIYQGANSIVEDSFEDPDGDGRMPFTYQTSFKMISQGSGENFVVNYLVHVSPNGDITIEEAGSTCRG